MGFQWAPLFHQLRLISSWKMKKRLFCQSFVNRNFGFVLKDIFICGSMVMNLESFLYLLNSLDPKLKFTQELEVERRLPFLDVLVHRNDTCFQFRVFRKPTHSDRYLNYSSNHCSCCEKGSGHFSS